MHAPLYNNFENTFAEHRTIPYLSFHRGFTYLDCVPIESNVNKPPRKGGGAEDSRLLLHTEYAAVFRERKVLGPAMVPSAPVRPSPIRVRDLGMFRPVVVVLPCLCSGRTKWSGHNEAAGF